MLGRLGVYFVPTHEWPITFCPSYPSNSDSLILQFDCSSSGCTRSFLCARGGRAMCTLCVCVCSSHPCGGAGAGATGVHAFYGPPCLHPCMRLPACLPSCSATPGPPAVAREQMSFCCTPSDPTRRQVVQREQLRGLHGNSGELHR